VDLSVDTDVSEEHNTSIFKPENQNYNSRLNGREIENFRNTYASEDACAQVTNFRPEGVCNIFIRNVSLYLKVCYVVTPYKLFKFVLAIAVSLISVATQMFECCDIVFNCSFILYEYLLSTQKPVSVTLNCTSAPFVRFENK
jgi:hypothetical protein